MRLGFDTGVRNFADCTALWAHVLVDGESTISLGSRTRSRLHLAVPWFPGSVVRLEGWTMR